MCNNFFIMENNIELALKSDTDLIKENVILPKQDNSFKTHKLLILIILFLFAVILILLGLLLLTPKRITLVNKYSLISAPSSSVSITTEAKNKSVGFLKTEVDATSLNSLNLADFPNSENIRGVAHYQDKIWISGDGSLIEYNSKLKQVTRFSDPKEAKCDSNLVIIGDYLLAPCQILTGELSKYDSDIPLYDIYKINLKTYSVDYIFTNKDGLLNQQNYELFADGNFVWVATFNGAARINSVNNKVDFFQNELAIKGGTAGTEYAVVTILPDKDYVWINVRANAYSKGGLALFDKKTQNWMAFGPEELRDDNNFERIDIYFYTRGYAIKLISDGIQISFDEGGMLVEKQYNYESKLWKKINSQTRVGDNSDKVYKYLTQTYPVIGEFGNGDENGYSQIYVSGVEQAKYILNGRSNLSISKSISGKRYLITSASLDFINSDLKLPKTIMDFNRRIGYLSSNSDPEVEAYATDGSNILIVVDSNVQAGMEYSYGKTMRVWAIDTKTDTILKEYNSNNKFVWRGNTQMETVIEGNKILLTQKTPQKEKILEYDLLLNAFSILDNRLLEN